MFFMVYVYKRQDLVYIKEDRNPIDENDTLVHILYKWCDFEATKHFLRPWKILNKPGDFYTLESLPILSKNLYEDQLDRNLISIDKKDIYKRANEYMGIAHILSKLNSKFGNACSISHNLDYLDKAEYTCDIQNYIVFLFGDMIGELIFKYDRLKEEEQEFLKQLSSISLTKEEKLEFIKKEMNNIDLNRVDIFLPPWCLGNLKVFGFESKSLHKSSIPEYLNAAKINGKPEESQIEDYIRQEIYEEFKLNEVLRGSEIKIRLDKIYDKIGLKRPSRLSDLLDYFEISKTRSEYEWSYRINLRKIL